MLIDRDRLFIRQKGKLLEIVTEFAILDEEGNRLGAIVQEGQTALKKLARLVSSLDQFMTHTLSVREADGTSTLRLTRPRKWFRSKIIIADGSGVPIGMIIQENVFGKIRFRFQDPSGATVGGINAQNWRAWNFSIVDANDREVGTITKTFAGLAKAMFTNADHYTYEINPSVTGALRQFGLASAAGVDLAIKQDKRGLG